MLCQPGAAQHGIIERLERPIGDSSGRPARPYRSVDTLAVMERRGSITAGMRQAGEDFRIVSRSRNLTHYARSTYRARGPAIVAASH